MKNCFKDWSQSNTVPSVGLQCVIVVFPDHTHLFLQLVLRNVQFLEKVPNHLVMVKPSRAACMIINRREVIKKMSRNILGPTTIASYLRFISNLIHLGYTLSLTRNHYAPTEY